MTEHTQTLAAPGLPTAATPRDGDPPSLNLLADFYDELPSSVAACVEDPSPQEGPAFSPGFDVPDLYPAMRSYLEAARAGWHELGEYAGRRLVLMDLAKNPGTHTTKTFPSLLIVARAIAHVHATHEPLMLFSPTSANKGTALRDAVLRAIRAGLVEPEQLRVAVLAPHGCRDKLRASELSTDPYLRELNPLFLHTGDGPAEQVKALGRAFVDAYGHDLADRGGPRLWFSLALPNYLVADTMRAHAEQTWDPVRPGTRRVHAHSVSSAFGMLGYHRGRDVLEARGVSRPEDRPGTLLVQHLGTPDMVLSLRHGSVDRAGLPAYTSGDDGVLRQDDDPHFPLATHSTDEVLDPTFYTRAPVTSPEMNGIIGRHGGDGVVVSLLECLERYPQLRARMPEGCRPLPADPRSLREWSLVMAYTGVCNAIDRGLVDADEVVVHGSGWYSDDEYASIPDDGLTPVTAVDDIAAQILASVQPRSRG